jgi:HK97 family phage portal protein
VIQIQSGGELVWEPWPWAGDWHVFSGNVEDYRSAERTILDPLTIWRTQRNVRTVVGFLARNFAQVQMHGYRRGEGGDRERIDPFEPLALTLREPDDNFTEYDFSYAMTVDLCIYERWAALKRRDDDGTIRLHRLPARRWRFIRDESDQPVWLRWWALSGSEWVDIPLDRLTWLDGYPLPDDCRYSPMEYLADVLVEEEASARARTDMWRNGARISGVIERPVNAPEWGSPQRNKFANAWRGAYGASGTRAGGTPILEDGMTYKSVETITPEQAQQIEARKLSMSEVAAAFYVAPVLVGVLDNANYSNVQAYREMLYTDTLGPMFQQSRQAYNARLVPDYGDPDLFVEPNVAEKLRMSFEEQARIMQTATGAPIMTRNEARQRMNLPHLDGADELIVPLNVLEGGQASPTDSAPPATASRVIPLLVGFPDDKLTAVAERGDGNGRSAT